MEWFFVGQAPLAQHPDTGGQGEDGQRHAGAGILAERDFHFAAGALHNDEIGDTPQQREVAGQGGGYGKRQPGARRGGQVGDEGLEDQHRRNVAHQVGQQRGEDTQRPGTIQMEAAGGGEEVGRHGRLLQAGDYDEEADEENQQAPIDLAVDLLGFDAAGEQEERAGDHGNLGDRPSGEEKDDHAGRYGERLPEQRAVDAHRAMPYLERLALAEFRAIDEGDHGNGEGESGGCHGGERGGEGAVWDERETADHHILRIARDGGHTADIGGHGVGHVERGEHAGYQDDARQQHQRGVRVIHHPRAHGGEEAGEAQVGHHDHHAEEKDDGVVIDGGVRFLHGEDVEGQHEAGADDGRAGAVHAEERDAAEGECEVGGGENEDGGDQNSIVSPGLDAPNLVNDEQAPAAGSLQWE